MPGYKIVLILLLILSILGGIAYGIYYIVTGGGANSNLSTFNAYQQVQEDKNYNYINENISKNDVAEYFDANFSNYYTCFTLEKTVFDELGKNLYFSNGKFEAKKDLDSSINAFHQSIKPVYDKLKYLIDNKNHFEKDGSINADDINHLKELASLVSTEFVVMVSNLNNVNNKLLPLVKECCLGGSFKGSVKYNMIEVILYQSNLLCSQLAQNNITTNTLDDCQKVYSKYLQQKEINFKQDAQSKLFVKSMDELSSTLKQPFFESTNKNEFAQAHGMANFEAIISFYNFGGEAWKNLF